MMIMTVATGLVTRTIKTTISRITEILATGDVTTGQGHFTASLARSLGLIGDPRGAYPWEWDS